MPRECWSWRSEKPTRGRSAGQTTAVSRPTIDISGARESGAGDDFHVLWATRRVLALLDPHSNLKRVVMEDLDPIKPVGSDPALMLGVDLAEFYGGADLGTATRVNASQLKYSHRHPGTAWTASRLSISRSGRAAPIKRLAGIFKGVCETVGRGRALEVLKVRLITNQPIQPLLSEALAAAQVYLAQADTGMQFGALLPHLKSAYRPVLKQLQGASGLRSAEFTDFVRVLELNGDELGRLGQELELTKALSHHVLANLVDHTRALYDLVRRSALPEGKGKDKPSPMCWRSSVSRGWRISYPCRPS